MVDQQILIVYLHIAIAKHLIKYATGRRVLDIVSIEVRNGLDRCLLNIHHASWLNWTYSMDHIEVVFWANRARALRMEVINFDHSLQANITIWICSHVKASWVDSVAMGSSIVSKMLVALGTRPIEWRWNMRIDFDIAQHIIVLSLHLYTTPRKTSGTNTSHS